MRKRTYLIAVAVFVAVSATLATMSIGETPKEKKAVDSRFAGKVVVVTLQSDSSHGGVLGEVKIKQLGGQSFIVGKGLDYGHPANWREGKTIWISMADISSFTEFPDIETYIEATSGISAASPY